MVQCNIVSVSGQSMDLEERQVTTREEEACDSDIYSVVCCSFGGKRVIVPELDELCVCLVCNKSRGQGDHAEDGLLSFCWATQGRH